MTDLFTPPENVVVPPNNTNEDPSAEGDYLSLLVGPGRKFKDVQALAYGKLKGDEHSSKLEQELSHLRQELKTRQSIQEFLEGQSKETPKAPHQPSLEAPSPNGDNGRMPVEVKPGMTKEEIIALAKQVVDTEKKNATVLSNIEKVKQTLVQEWGGNYEERLKARANELGVGPEFLNKLAAEAPSAALALLVDTKTKNNPGAYSPPQGARSTVSFDSNNANGHHDQEYWENLRKTNPKQYKSRDSQAKMHSDALALGAAFFSKKK